MAKEAQKSQKCSEAARFQRAAPSSSAAEGSATAERSFTETFATGSVPASCSTEAGPTSYTAAAASALG